MTAASTRAKVGLTIIICTYRREDLLSRALASISSESPQADLQVDVLVVDNSDDGSAKKIVEAAQGGAFGIRWMEAHPANISVARNAGVAATSSAWFAFLDDDQEVAPGWLAAVAEAIARLPHDAFFGAVDARFEAPDLATPLVRQLFSRKLDATQGDDLFAMGPEKTAGIALSTANSIFRRAALPADETPFDLTFGNGGGEDYDLLCRMQAQGRRFGWLPAARAREFVPAARCRQDYLWNRFYAGGQAFAAAIAKRSAHPQRARWAMRAKGAVQASLLGLLYPFKAMGDSGARADHAYRLAGALGKASLADIRPIYRQNDSAS
ncbi:MAG: glycosyltransferase family 2 protein [Hyphomicrobiales bacterium]|nr:glycosyltransferase family 2 protein [Hyphomicrobiales bacterium]